MRISKLFFIAAMIALITPSLLFFGCGFRKSTEELKADRQKSDIIISAEDLFKAWSADRKSADEKYFYLILTVSGTVERTGLDVQDKPYVLLKGDPSLGGVQCFFLKQFNDQASRLQPGQKVTVRGRCTDFIMNVILQDCSIQS